MKKILLLLVLCLGLPGLSVCFAQTPVWALKTGSPGNDISYCCKVGPNGNICIAGKFTGTMDLDPGAGVYNIVSNGLDDIFVACYSPTGGFLWGNHIGGGYYDGAQSVTIDANNDVIICGYYRGPNVDFDPGPGTFLLSGAGTTGSITTCGEGFVAKFSSTGVFQWAKSLGAETIFDNTFDVATDGDQNIYTCGFFTGTMIVSPTITWNSTVTGKGYVIKYNPSGTLVWAKVFGLPGYGGDDTYPWSIRVKGTSIYTCGVLQATSDMDPGPGVINFTSIGLYDGYVAKYDTAGNYIATKKITGVSNNEQTLCVGLDNADGVYVTGITQGTAITFDPTTPGTTVTATAGGGGNNDIYIAKFDTNLNYQWGHIVGSTGSDIPRRVEVIGNNVYFTGHFQGTVDFDPSAAVANLTSHGGDDIFVNKYDLAGNYLCGFDIGSTGEDQGWGFSHDAAGALYLTGDFSGTATDFDPSTATYPLTSTGGTDAFLVKYDWSATSVTGYLTGDTICSGQTPYLTLHITSGYTGPFTIQVTNGTGTYTYTGVNSGVPFALSPLPTSTTTYSLTSISYPGVNICSAPSAASFGSATVLVTTIPVSINSVILSCNSISLSSGTTATTYTWSLGDGGTSTAGSVTHTYATSGTYSVTLSITNAAGCSATDTITVTTGLPPIVNLGPDTSICIGSSTSLHSTITYPAIATYLWNTGSTTPSISIGASGIYWLQVTIGGCVGSDTVAIDIMAPPSIDLGHDTAICTNGGITLTTTEPSGTTYQWSTGSTSDSLYVSATGTYWLQVTNGCPASDTIYVQIIPIPVVTGFSDTTICIGETTPLTATGGFSYTWTPAIGLSCTACTTTNATPTVSNTYVVTGTNENGCKGSDSVTVLVHPKIVSHGWGDTVVCQYTPVQLFDTGGETYTWIPATGLSSNSIYNPIATPDSTTQYMVIARAGSCKPDTNYITVGVHPSPTVDAGLDQKLIASLPAELHATGTNIASLLWTPDSTLSCDTCAITISNSLVTTRYVVCAKTTFGCKACDEVVVYRYCGVDQIFLPNSFTPNGNGQNDVFYPRGAGIKNIKYFRIYNRWGELVFERTNFALNDESAGWDGYFNGKAPRPDVYVYLLDAVCETGEPVFIKGDVSIIK